MMFPLLLIVLFGGVAASLIADGEIAGAVITVVIFVAPLTAFVLNYFWFYRLELTPNGLTRHRFYGWFEQRIDSEESIVVELQGPRGFGGRQIVFKSPDRQIRLLWRSQFGWFWPVREIRLMLGELESRGVLISPGVWEYLGARHP